MKLQFEIYQINQLAAQYVGGTSERDRRLTKEITEQVFPSYEQKGYLAKNEFLTACGWKTPRSKPHCESNDENFIKEISSLAKVTNCEQLRIQSWTLLAGVNWPTASVFLHFAFPNKYPILDFRALWSIGTDVPKQYTFPFWQEYTNFCRALALEANVDLRTLDQALWKYSDLNQKS